jgi:hypothetical protein
VIVVEPVMETQDRGRQQRELEAVGREGHGFIRVPKTPFILP